MYPPWFLRDSRTILSAVNTEVKGQAMMSLAANRRIPTAESRARRFAARVSGLASGLALAVRPAGSVEAPALKGGS